MGARVPSRYDAPFAETIAGEGCPAVLYVSSPDSVSRTPKNSVAYCSIGVISATSRLTRPRISRGSDVSSAYARMPSRMSDVRRAAMMPLPETSPTRIPHRCSPIANTSQKSPPTFAVFDAARYT